ncbi:acyl-CoA dehydrogenase family protein [Parahaliea sp. F7430]|uniref:Acyl-CoA dehydrogenase family protein n=1 Tax=Sediminihaliea albiluteola TaxID=2758564 RepID=A0A7W2TV11_9GAMM|nr:acyl-CoA dehydrogenase family protein [Sediminihaliea albiluteola]MBA6412464.1 acyl-CoA dehydrogenase family protein [Sediminihaliea albiluteola]
MIPRTIFTEEHRQFRDSVRKFLQEEALPHHDQWELEGQVSRELWQKAGAQGLLAPSVTEQYGGVGVDYLYNTIISEEIARMGLSGIGFGLHSDIAVPYIEHHGTEQQKQKYLPACLSGEIITAIAMTEPGTGSDLQGVKTSAILDGDEYVLNGSKTFITNGQMADLVIVVCKTDPSAGAQGISLMLVEAGTPGFLKGSNLHKLGMKAQDTSELFFQDVRIPKENLLGEEGKGFIYLMQELPQERLGIAVSAVANAESVLEQTVAYVKERKAFGKPIAAFQNTQFKLAEMDSKLTAMRVFIDRCIELHIKGALDAVSASKAKLLATELQCEVIDQCLQLHGGYGYMWEYPVARAYADARVQRIYGGTSEVMKLIVARSLLAD